jgi:hypothetical protein
MRMFPVMLGGGYDEPQKAYRVLLAAEGIGGSADNQDGIDGLWRRSRAVGLSAATSANRRACLNAWPFLVTDLLPYYERVLGVTVPPGQSDTDRRAVVAALWPAKASAIVKDMLSELKRIDSRFSLLTEDPLQSVTDYGGRAFGPMSGVSEATFGGLNFSSVGFYSTHYIIRVLLPVGIPSAVDNLSMRTAAARLRTMLPSWCDFTITTSTGFLCDTSPLDTTGMN